MRDGVAAVNTTPMKVYELGPSGWTLAPSNIPVGTNYGFDMRIDNGRIITTEGACSWDGRIVAKATDGVWRKAATLPGAFHDCESTIAGSVDILGNRAIVHQDNSLSTGFPYGEQQTWIFRRNAQGWAREGVATLSLIWPQEQRYFWYNTRAAISGPDVLVASELVGVASTCTGTCRARASRLRITYGPRTAPWAPASRRCSRPAATIFCRKPSDRSVCNRAQRLSAWR